MSEELRAIAIAAIKRRRVYGPSGKFIMHGVPLTHRCRLHGMVTKYHFCKMDCKRSGFKCLPGCSRESCEGPGSSAKMTPQDTISKT